VFVGAVRNGVCYGVWVGLGVRGQANAMTYFRRNFFNLRKSVCVPWLRPKSLFRKIQYTECWTKDYS